MITSVCFQDVNCDNKTINLWAVKPARCTKRGEKWIIYSVQEILITHNHNLYHSASKNTYKSYTHTYTVMVNTRAHTHYKNCILTAKQPQGPRSVFAVVVFDDYVT